MAPPLGGASEKFRSKKYTSARKIKRRVSSFNASVNLSVTVFSCFGDILEGNWFLIFVYFCGVLDVGVLAGYRFPK